MVVMLCTAWLGCADEDTAPAGPGGEFEDVPDAGATVSFSRDVQPIFASRCAICHYRGSPVVPDLNDPLDPEFGVRNFENTWFPGHDSDYEYIVRPGEPDESFLIYKVATDPSIFDTANNGSPMPLAIEPLTAAELSAVRQWVSDGAEDDAFFQESVAPIFGTEPGLGRKAGKCTYCHYDGSPTGMSVIDVFDPLTGLKNAPSLLSSKLRVAPGAPDDSFLIEKLEEETPSSGGRMPLHYPRLSAQERYILITWIAEGARDN
jgi:hypothetical protein